VETKDCLAVGGSARLLLAEGLAVRATFRAG